MVLIKIRYLRTDVDEDVPEDLRSWCRLRPLGGCLRRNTKNYNQCDRKSANDYILCGNGQDASDRRGPDIQGPKRYDSLHDDHDDDRSR